MQKRELWCRRITSLFKAGFDDNEQMYRSMFIYRETRQNSSIQGREKAYEMITSAQITQQIKARKSL